mgnify:CR=1 FL=1
MSFKDTQSYKELQADWRWIHEMDPEAAAAADQWVKEHPEEWTELEHMLYYSEANFTSALHRILWKMRISNSPDLTIRKRSCRRKYAMRFTMTDVGLTEASICLRVLMKIPSCIWTPKSMTPCMH